MRKICLALLLAFSVSAYAGFTGPYAPGNWTWVDPGVGGFGTLDADTMYVVGGDSYVSGGVGYYIDVPAAATLEFDWSYFSINSPGWDYAFYSVNGVMTMLSDTSGGAGAASVPVSAGDSFGLGVYTVDGAFGPGELTVTNFIPEPASLALLALGALALRRR